MKKGMYFIVIVMSFLLSGCGNFHMFSSESDCIKTQERPCYQACMKTVTREEDTVCLKQVWIEKNAKLAMACSLSFREERCNAYGVRVPYRRSSRSTSDYKEKLEKQSIENINKYTKAIQKDPNDAELHVKLGRAYNRTKQYDQAIQEFGKAIKIDPSNEKAYHSRSFRHMKNGNYDIALKDINKSIALKIAAISYVIRARIYHKQGKHDLALDDFDKAIEMEPKSARFYKKRGLFYFNDLDDKYKGCLDLKKACDLREYYCKKYSKELKQGNCS